MAEGKYFNTRTTGLLITYLILLGWHIPANEEWPEHLEGIVNDVFCDVSKISVTFDTESRQSRLLQYLESYTSS